MTMINIMINMKMVNDDNYDDSFVACSTFKVISRAHMPSPFTPFHRARALCNSRHPPPSTRSGTLIRVLVLYSSALICARVLLEPALASSFACAPDRLLIAR